MPETQSLIGFHSSGDSVKPIQNADNRYRTVNGLEPEKQRREMVIVPCSLRQGFTIDGASNHFNEIEQSEIRNALQTGYFISTEHTGGQSESNLALLMSFAPGHVYAGRGGILMHKDNGTWKPVTLTIQSRLGNRKYILDIKGTGTPEGILRRDKKVGFIGGIDTANMEFDTLTAAEQQHPLRHDGVVPVGVYFGHDYRGYGQVARAIPTTLRPSFKFNAGFEQLKTLSPEEIARGLGLELGRYLGFNPPRLGSNLQTENAYLVDTDKGQLVIATDFAEIVPLHEEIRPIFGLDIALEIICASIQDDPDVFQHVAISVIAGIKELRPDLPISDNDVLRMRTKDQLIDYLLKRYLAKEILDNRKKLNTVINSSFLCAKLDDVSAQFYKEHPAYTIPREIDKYLEEEERLFQIVGSLEKGTNKKITDSLEYIMEARRKLFIGMKEYEITDENVTDYEALLPIPYYSAT
jgi:hypothetical protein